ncbi:OOP family OmpA-OmpF porin [Sphingomonas jejuensis]|uniref:OOP family OmpA-OmpF porin n=1 Tax=Sphingomonas jejuensis TaxID=904715 RepID=A0ABX0XHH0_9SPHN|nr:OmpA family protein [Sphingomonas jejuensis]NJC32659.1 OOP family OmpA-OmpF porin [Sphingomonas jejuensis]
MHRHAIILLAATTAACTPPDQPGNDAPAVQLPAVEAPTLANDAEEAKSIMRPDVTVAPPPEEAHVAAPLSVVIDMPDGVALDDAGRAALDRIVASEALAAGGTVTIGGHSDTRGDDDANLDVSRRRAEAVRDALVERGVAADRITIIAFGETRPRVPNARPDGTDDPEARAANRRVDVTVTPVPAAPAPPDDPVLSPAS